ncbi:lysozyme [soil metagenome]
MSALSFCAPPSTMSSMRTNLTQRFARWRNQLGAVNRQLIAVLAFSASGLVGIALNEGYTTRAIPDPVKGTAVPTIGFGTTNGVKMSDSTTPPQALQRLLTDVQAYEGALKRCVRVPLHQHEYDAYIDLSYNIGAATFCGSTLVKRLNAGDYAGACAAILDWKYVGQTDCSVPGNRTCQGVWTRRLKLNKQCKGEAQ